MKKLFFWCAAMLAACGAYAESEGERLFNENQPDKAAPVLEKEIAEGRVEANTFNILGLSYFQLGDYVKAMDAFERGLKNPVSNRRQIAFNEGSVAYTRGDYIKAENCFSLAIAARPDFSQAILNRANTRIMTQKYKEAEADYRRFLELEPDDEQADNIRLLLSYLTEDLRKKEEDEARIAESKRQTEEENRRIEEALMQIAAGYGAASAVHDAQNGAGGNDTTGTSGQGFSGNGTNGAGGAAGGNLSDGAAPGGAGENKSFERAGADGMTGQNVRKNSENGAGATPSADTVNGGMADRTVQERQSGQNSENDAAGSQTSSVSIRKSDTEDGVRNQSGLQGQNDESSQTKLKNGDTAETSAAQSLGAARGGAENKNQQNAQTDMRDKKGGAPYASETAVNQSQNERNNRSENTSALSKDGSQNGAAQQNGSGAARGGGNAPDRNKSGGAADGTQNARTNEVKNGGAAAERNSNGNGKSGGTQDRASPNAGAGRQNGSVQGAGKNAGQDKSAGSSDPGRQAAGTDTQAGKNKSAAGAQKPSGTANGRQDAAASGRQAGAASQASANEARQRKFREDVVRSLKRGDTTNMSAGAEEIIDYEHEPELD